MTFIPNNHHHCRRDKTVVFGANDATCAAANNGFHVLSGEYKEKFKAILSYPGITAQECRVLLIALPPVDEHQHRIKDAAAGRSRLTRFAHLANECADVRRSTGGELGLPVLDLWSSIMRRAGWEGDEVLAGSVVAPKNDVLGELLSDGK